MDTATLGGWLDLIAEIEADPRLLVALRHDDPAVAAEVEDMIHRLAIEAAQGTWRDPIFGARPEQLMPGTPGSFSDRDDWDYFLIQGGRGSGKSRAGGEAVREMLMEREWRKAPRGALVSRKLELVRTDMIEETLLEVLPPGSIAKWNRNAVELWVYLPEKHLGRRRVAKLRGYSSEAPQNLRGPNFAFAWADEVAAWVDADRSPQAPDTTWSNLANAVRARDDGAWVPRIIATTTPKSVRLIRNPDEADPLNPGPGLHDDPDAVVSEMSTLDNEANLSARSIRRVQAYRGTRLWIQEIEGKLLDEDEGALWSFEDIQRMTVPVYYPERDSQGGGIERVVVGVDPSVGAGRGDEAGVVVVGLAADGNVYVLADYSVRAPAPVWCRRVRDAYNEFGADAVVVEANQGGELVAETLGRYARNLPIREVWAKKGKKLRAEPVQLLSQNGRVFFAGEHDKLTSQMRTWDPETAKESPDRVDAFVYAVLDLLPVESSAGDVLTVVRAGRRA